MVSSSNCKMLNRCNLNGDKRDVKLWEINFNISSKFNGLEKFVICGLNRKILRINKIGSYFTHFCDAFLKYSFFVFYNPLDQRLTT